MAHCRHPSRVHDRFGRFALTGTWLLPSVALT
jgi:hypothetical protein